MFDQFREIRVGRSNVRCFRPSSGPSLIRISLLGFGPGGTKRSWSLTRASVTTGPTSPGPRSAPSVLMDFGVGVRAVRSWPRGARARSRSNPTSSPRNWLARASVGRVPGVTPSPSSDTTPPRSATSGGRRPDDLPNGVDYGAECWRDVNTSVASSASRRTAGSRHVDAV